MKPLHTLTATEAAARIAAGELQSERLVRACLDRIASREPEIRAWAHLDVDGVLRAAREADKQRQSKARPLGALHGIPIAVKDIIATAGLRTECNSEVFRDTLTHMDAAVVTLLRAAGAIIMGKTETVELAAWGGRVAPTANPHDLARTPGGSSSGSAAVVADFMVPLALGTQTGGSIIRPASFCGVVGFKPTFGTLSTEGVKHYAPTLDTVGWYARSVADVALLARVLEVSDQQIPKSLPLRGLCIGAWRTPYWAASSPETRDALAEAKRRLCDAGAIVAEVEFGEDFLALDELTRIVMRGQGRISFLHLDRTAPDKISATIRKGMERMSSDQLCAALDRAAALRPAFDTVARRFDAVMVPSAPGEAPIGLASTGSWIFNGLWTLLHVPCVNLPGLTGPHGLPVGIQLVAPRYADAHLLTVAQTVSDVLQSSGLQ